VRKATTIVSSICDDRGEEPTYNNLSISEIISKGMGIGDVLGLLWFKRVLPRYATKFFEVLFFSPPLLLSPSLFRFLYILIDIFLQDVLGIGRRSRAMRVRSTQHNRGISRRQGHHRERRIRLAHHWTPIRWCH
jgi:hypothetical protein